MTENKITIAINPNQNKKIPQMDGMIALKKIENYSYALTDEIGLGYSSHVYRGKNQLNNETVAIKVIDLRKQDQLSKQFVNQQISILEAIKLRNPHNLLRLFDVFKTKNNMYIITEFCEGKDAAKLLRKKKSLSEMQAQSILKQLMNAYRQLYELEIVHRDLKLANIFVKKGVLKLADFGFAIRSQECFEKFEYNVGSPYYMPPQSLKFNRYSYKSDVWSIGIMAYEMIYGKLPWKEKVQSVLFQKITTTPIEDLFDPEVPLTDHYKKFICSCLQIDYDKRATPQFIISYQWPLSQDYVQGVQADNGGYKPHSLVKLPSSNVPSAKQFGTANAIEDEGKNEKGFKVHHQISLPSQPFQQRQKSPTKQQFNHYNVFDEPPKYKAIFRQNSQRQGQTFFSEPTFGQGFNQQNQSFQDLSNLAELSILNQIHYCRFMSQLFDFIDQNGVLPQGYLIKNEIAAKIINKYDVLVKLAQGQNLLMIQGFNQYKNSERWLKLKEIISRYERQYKQKFSIQFKNDSNEQVLVNSIKYLKGNIGNNFYLLQELAFYYQLRDLERRLNPSQFAQVSKLELLSTRKSLGRNETVGNALIERLNNRLNLLGFV